MAINPEYLVQCLRIEPKSGPIVRLLLSYPVNLKMSTGEIYIGGIYAQPTAISSSLNGSPTVIDIGSVYDADALTRDQIQSGYWEGAKVYSFFTTWTNPIVDELPDRLYTLGKVREEDDHYVIEMMSSLDRVNQSSGKIITAGCPYVWDDAHVDGTIIASTKSKCKVSSPVININSQILSVISQSEFTGSGLASYPDDWFGNGELIFTSGLNAGLPFKIVKSFSGGQLITLAQPFYFPTQMGDAFLIRTGCRKRFQEDCIGKFDNGIHFGGYPHVPQKSVVLKFGDQ